MTIVASGCSRPAAKPSAVQSWGIFGGTALREIPEVVSRGGLVSFTLTARLDRRRRPAFFYQGTEVAPTIRLAGGDTIRVTLVNELPYYCGPGVVSNVNLHFHGLWTAPVAPGDEVVTTKVAPKHSYEYVVHVPRDQPPGLYWYHPHAHGLTAFEVGNGMSGAIVVRGLTGVVPELAGLRERIVVLRNVPKAAEPDGDFPIANRASKALDALLAHRGDSCRPDLGSTLTVNGNVFATIGIRPRERELLRVLNASPSRFVELTVDGEPLRLVAADGVPVRYESASTYVSRSSISIPPGGRAEFIVTGGDGPRAIVSRCVSTGRTGDPAPAAIIGTLNDDSGRAGGVRMAKEATPLPTSILPAPSVSRIVTLGERGRSFFIDGSSYRPGQPPAFVSHVGTVERWLVRNDTDEVHVFHVHQTHFAIESRNGVSLASRMLEDEVVVPPRRFVLGKPIPSSVGILVDFRHPQSRGIVLFHCHILDHEDGGMMSSLKLL